MNELRARLTGSPSYRWVVVGLLWLVCFCNYADRQSIFSVFSLLKTEFALSDLQLGVVAACFMWMYAIFGPIAGWITDRVSRSWLIVVALSFWSVVTGATALAHSYPMLVALRALGGLGEAFYFPAAMSLIGSYHGASTRSRAMSLHQTSVYAGSIAGGALSAYVAAKSGWRVSFGIFGGAGVLLALVLLALLRDPDVATWSEPYSGPVAPVDEREAGLLENLKAVFGNESVVELIAVFMGANFVAVIFLTWLPTFLLRKFHMDLASAGLNGTAYLQVASVVGVLAGGFLADRASRRWRGGRQLVQAIGLLGGVPFLFLTGWSLAMRGVVLGMIGFGLFKGLYDANIFASLYDFVKPERRGFAAGLMNSLGWLGGGVAPIAVAAAATHFSLGVCLSATSAIYLVLASCLGLLFWRRKA